MSKVKFIMLVGLPCSGKSTMAQKLAKEHNAEIFSSDELREELFGDVNCQDKNQELFSELHKRIKNCIRSGKSAIYDATNIKYKRRMAFLRELKQISCEKICALMATPYVECLKRNDKRDRKVPREVIMRMYTGFDVPWYYEGWDSIEVEYSEGSENSFGLPRERIDELMNFSQENPHHTLSLGQHCLEAMRYVDAIPLPDMLLMNAELHYAALLHDIGKPFCQTFENNKENGARIAHYYNHEHVSSYDSLFYAMACAKLYVAVLIRWHMQLYFNKLDKTKEKFKALWGAQLTEELSRLHAGDVAAH